MGLFINPGKSKIQALVLVGEKLGFNTKLMEHSGVKVAHFSLGRRGWPRVHPDGVLERLATQKHSGIA